LLQNRHCECNSDFKKESWDPVKNGWGAWVDLYHKLIGSKVDQDWMDLAQCWMNNPRDMINLQNALWWKRASWNNQRSTVGDYSNPDNYVSWRRYWGWNEVPVARDQIQNASNWDAVVIYLPAALEGRNTPDCLSSGAKNALVKSFDKWISAGYLQAGVQHIKERPGSYVLFVRQVQDNSLNYQNVFFCQNWQSPGKYKVVYDPMSPDNPTGACWLDTQEKEDVLAKSTSTAAYITSRVPSENLSLLV